MIHLFYCKECDQYQNTYGQNNDDTKCIHNMNNYSWIQVSFIKYIWLKLKGKIYEQN